MFLKLANICHVPKPGVFSIYVDPSNVFTKFLSLCKKCNLICYHKILFLKSVFCFLSIETPAQGSSFEISGVQVV